MTGYVVHYRTSSSVGTNTESSSSTSTDITDLTSGATYTISVEATSQHLSGESEEMAISLSELTYIIRVMFGQILVPVHLLIQFLNALF